MLLQRKKKGKVSIGGGGPVGKKKVNGGVVREPETDDAVVE